MNFEDIRNILKTSNPKDWLYDNNYGIYTYKPDVELNILTQHPDEPDSNKKFEEDWTNKFSNKNAWMLVAKVYYSGSFVRLYLFVRADGDRIIIGMPKSAAELEITHLQYNMGKIMSYRNIEGNLSDYDPRFNTSEIEVNKALIY
jgi:hypothetical protein